MWSRKREVMTDSEANQPVTNGSETVENVGQSDNSVTVEVETHPVPTVTGARRNSGNAYHDLSNHSSTQEVVSEASSSGAATVFVPSSPPIEATIAVTTTPIAASGHSGVQEESGSQAGSTETPQDSSGSPPSSEQNNSSNMSGNSGDNVHSRSNSRRQRNGLFGINIDLNFDPTSWLVPSNVAGRSISSLSMLPEWARPPVNISIPNRDNPSSVVSESRHSLHHQPVSSTALGGGAASRLVSHTSVPPSSPSDWNSPSYTSSGHVSGSTPNIQHHHHHAVPRTRYTVASMRSVDEDLDADYNPVSNIDLGMGRDRESNSYVIDMDTPMGGWAEDDVVPSTSVGGGAGNGSGGTSGPDGNPLDNNGARRSISDMNVPPNDANAPSMADATTAASERTRAAEILRDAPETRAFINEISRYTTIRPFIVINFLKGVFDHGTSILAFLALVVTFSHANSMVKKEVSKQRKRNLLYLSMIVINLAACVAFIYYIFNDMELYYALIFLPTSSDLSSFWSLMWAIGVTDYVAKFGTVFMKIWIVALPGCMLPFQKRGKYYLFIEHSSQLYRSFLPIYPWMFYLVSAYEGTARMFGLFLAGLYVFFKITDTYGRFKEWLKAFEKLLSNVHYGTSPSAKQLDSAGTICPICHDNFTSPTRLSCSHIFCEECVATWFDRERTCPMCRAKVVDDPTYRDGSTSQYVQLF